MPTTITFPLVLGRKDSVDRKFAPNGVLGTCKNLRVRKDGRLACRNGYQRFSMDSLVAYDLHEFNTRLVAFGSKELDGFPQQVVEYTGLAGTGILWRRETTQQELTPFVDVREIAISSPPSSGVDEADSAVGGGYVCCLQRSVSGVVTAVICRESDNQPLSTEVLSDTRSTAHFRVTYAAATSSFYVMSARSNNSIDLLFFQPGVHSAWAVHVNQAFPAHATAAVFDIVPVENPTTGPLGGTVVAMDRGVATDLTVRVYDANGTAVGADITVAATDTISISLAADQTANVIHLGTVITGGSVTIRTYNFATRALLAGPSSVAGGTHVSICRVPASAVPLTSAQVAVLHSTSAGATVINFWPDLGGAITATATVETAVMTTRVIPWIATTHTDNSERYSVVFGGYVAPNIAAGTTNASNAIFFVATSGAFVGTNCAHMATRDFGRAMPRTYRGVGLHLDATTGRVGWCTLKNGGSGSAQVSVTTFPKHSTARRQTARFGSLLYVAGSPLQAYDGRSLVEAFQEIPGIVSATPSAAAGALTNSANYTYVVHWELTLADGSFWQSAPSSPKSVTMGATHNTVTVVVTTPHHSAVGLGDHAYGPEISAVLSRTEWNGSTEGSVLRRAVVSTVPIGLARYGDTLSIVDTVSDATLGVQEALYTQADRGPLSGCLEHNAGRGCKFVAVSESRLYLSGLLASNRFQVSKDAFLDEPFTFSEFSSFFGQVSANVRGLFSLDGARLLFTAEDIFAVGGTGPDDLGGGGLDAPVRLPSPSGLEDWRSFLEVPDGLFFQLDDDKLYLLPRGGGSPVPVGADVQDTFATYPIITGTAKSRRDEAALFACQNTAAGSDARILVRDMPSGLWSEDTPPLTTSRGIEAITSYGDTVAYISGGVVFVQNPLTSATSFIDDSSTVIPTTVKTHPVYPFGLGGTGLIHDFLLVGEYLSAGSLALRVSYDDGATFAALSPFTLTGLTVGQTVKRKWALPVVGAKSLVMEITFTPSTPGAGFICHSATLLLSPDTGLPELDPSEQT